MSTSSNQHSRKRPYVEDSHRHDPQRLKRELARRERRRGGEAERAMPSERPGREVKKVTVEEEGEVRRPTTEDDLTFELLDEEEEERRIQEQRRKRREIMLLYEKSEGEKVGEDRKEDVGPVRDGRGEDAVKAGECTKEHISPVGKETHDVVGPVGKNTHDDAGKPTPTSLDLTKPPQQADAQAESSSTKDVSAAHPAVADGIGEREDDSSEYEEIEVEDDEDDVDVDDMFAVSDDDGRDKAQKKTKIVRVKKSRNNNTAQQQHITTHAGLTDNWDDPEGYYRIVLGERIGPKNRFHIFANLGKGMFSEVVRAKDLGPDGTGSGESEVAIKVVRSQETMYKAGLKEISILNKLSTLDPQDKRHIIRLVSHFSHRGHLCMVFESLHMNLREVVKRFGKDVGLNLNAVKAYTHQILLGLSLMKRGEIMHADLKPDNILVNDSKTLLKICDLGSASSTSENEITPYLVSRFYRAPEIILGSNYDTAIDMWSTGCTLYELYTGKILFPGKSNNHMLLLIQELKGKFTTRLIRKGQFSHQHFDENNTFLLSTGTNGVQKVTSLSSSHPVSDLRRRLLPPAVAKTLPEKEVKMIGHFVDLLGRMLELDPAKRISPNDALKHPFLA